jgi:hypothetical protein
MLRAQALRLADLAGSESDTAVQEGAHPTIDDSS